jgi:hypothetical protein
VNREGKEGVNMVNVVYGYRALKPAKLILSREEWDEGE